MKTTTTMPTAARYTTGTANHRGHFTRPMVEDHRVEEQGDDGRDQEDEDRVTGRAGEVQSQEDGDWYQHQLNPAGYGDAH